MFDIQEPKSAVPNITVLSGSAHPALAASVARELGVELGRCDIQRFPDGETHLQVDPRDVDGRDVFVVQPTSSVASEHLFELLLAADACRHAGAISVNAVVPYFGYARQDRRKNAGEALGARVAAKLFGVLRFDSIVAVDLHSQTVEAALDVSAEHLSAVPLLASALEDGAGRESVVVAPDLGAERLARDYARLLRLPMAVVHKVRRSATDVAVERVVGDVRGLRPILVDDIVATGGTLVAAAGALREQGCKGEIVVAATHGIFTNGAIDRLLAAGLSRFVVTDTIPRPFEHPSIEVVSVAPLLGSCVRRLARRKLDAVYLLHP